MTDAFSFKAAPTQRPKAVPPVPPPNTMTAAPPKSVQDVLDEAVKAQGGRRKRRTRAELEAAGVKPRGKAAAPRAPRTTATNKGAPDMPPDLVVLKRCVTDLRTLSPEDARRVFMTLEALFK